MASGSDNGAADVGREHVAGIYAKAFLDAAEATGDVDARLAELDSFIDDVLDGYPEFEKLLSSRMVGEDDKQGIVERVLAGRGSQRLVDLLKVLSRHERLDCLRAIRRAIHAQLDYQRGRRKVEVRTAWPVDEKLSLEIATAIRARTGIEPVVTQVVDPNLLGGLIIKIEDIVCDGSVATGLKNLRGEMVHRSLEMIQSHRERLVEESASGA